MEGALSGIRIVEVASWTFVPSGGAILAEWGADVIKVEDPARGDPLRGLVSASIRTDGGVNPMLEIANRGKRSVAIDISQEAGREILYQLIASADVFVTSHLPAVRRRPRHRPRPDPSALPQGHLRARLGQRAEGR